MIEHTVKKTDILRRCLGLLELVNFVVSLKEDGFLWPDKRHRDLEIQVRFLACRIYIGCWALSTVDKAQFRMRTIGNPAIPTFPTIRTGSAILICGKKLTGRYC